MHRHSRTSDTTVVKNLEQVELFRDTCARQERLSMPSVLGGDEIFSSNHVTFACLAGILTENGSLMLSLLMQKLIPRCNIQSY